MTKEHIPLIRNIFHMMTGVVKDIHRSAAAPILHSSIPVNSIKVLIYAIHNLFDEFLFKGLVVYPEALNN